MRAIEVDAFGGADTLTLKDVPAPVPATGEVLVNVAFSGVNFTDIYRREGHYANSPTYPTTLPFRPGLEGAGTVAALGPDVEGLAIGDRVAFGQVKGTYAEQCAAPADHVIRLPDSLASDKAAAVMVQGMTAHYLSHSAYPLKPGDTCLIHAGAGGVGQLLIQLAKRRGAQVIATAGGRDKVAIAKARGADAAIDYLSEDFAERVLALTNGEGVNVVYESVGMATFEGSLRSLRPLGTCILFGHASGKVPPVDPMDLSEAGSVFLTRPHMHHYVATPAAFAGRANDVFAWTASGELQVTIDKVFPLEQAAAAHRAMESRQTRGKILLSTNTNAC